jgi:hypothetical protein
MKRFARRAERSPNKLREMSDIALITPTYSHDFERCSLLCESVDRYVTSFTRHYLIVPDDEVALFAKLASERRLVVPVSELLPRWLRSLPRFITRKNRRYWWSMRAIPVNGWHVQQFVKIAAASVIQEPVSCILDSDIVFFRKFDLAKVTRGGITPLHVEPRDVAGGATDHANWVRSSFRVLGLGQPKFPADDYIGHIIFWNQRAVRAMTARIEQVTGLHWVDALCRAHAISEYMLYGYFVRNDSALLCDHRLTSESPCLSYWDEAALDQPALKRLLQSATDQYAAFSAASFSGTSVEDIREVLAEFEEPDSASLIGPNAAVASARDRLDVRHYERS